MVSVKRNKSQTLILIVVLLAGFAITVKAQEQISPEFKAWCDKKGGTVLPPTRDSDGKIIKETCEVKDGDSSSSGGSSGGSNSDKPYELGGLIGKPLNKLLCKIPWAGGCPKKPSKKERMRAKALAANQQGIDYEKQGEWEMAVAAFREALENDPDDDVIRQNLAGAEAHIANERGVQRYSRGDYAGALIAFQEALDKVPDVGVYRQNLAQTKDALANQRALEMRELERRAQEAAEAQEAKERAARGIVEKNKIAAANMQKAVEHVSKTLTAVSSSDGLDFDRGGKNDGLDFTTSLDASVVDLRDARTLTLDPTKVKGTYSPGRSETFKQGDRESKIKLMNALAKSLPDWSPDEQARLAKALDAIDEDGTPATIGETYEVWARMEARGNDPEFLRMAAKIGGVGFPGAGTQSTNDCTIFALANAAGLPYGVAAARATKLIAEGEWRSPADRANPEAVFKKGLNGLEVIMLAEAFGQAEVVASSSFSKTLDEGRPILVGVVLTQRDEKKMYSQGYHEVVLTKSFLYKGETYFEVMDSNQPANVRSYLTKNELSVIMFENGVAVRAEEKTTVKPLR